MTEHFPMVVGWVINDPNNPSVLKFVAELTTTLVVWYAAFANTFDITIMQLTETEKTEANFNFQFWLSFTVSTFSSTINIFQTLKTLNNMKKCFFRCKSCGYNASRSIIA